MNATFKNKSIHKCTWHQENLSLRLMIEFVIVLSDLHTYVLDTWVKRGAEVSAAGENTGQDWHIQMWIVRMCWPRSAGSSTPTSDRTLKAFWQKLGTLSLNGPSSAPLLQRWLEAVCYAPCFGCNLQMVDTGGEESCQAGEVVLLSMATYVIPECSSRQKLQLGTSSGKGKELPIHTVYSRNGTLLTSTSRT